MGSKSNANCDIDGLLVIFAGLYLGRMITIISSQGTWTSEPGVNHDIILIHRGGNVFYDTDVEV